MNRPNLALARARSDHATIHIPARRVGMAVATISMLALVSAPAAAAAIRYASPGGGATGAEPCLSSDPCNLPNAIEGHAPADVNDGDRVVVLGGMGAFNPAGQINISKQIDIGGAAGGPVPVINGAGTRGLNGQIGGISLHDLRIDQATGSAAFSLENGSAERVFATYGGGTHGRCLRGGRVDGGARQRLLGDREPGRGGRQRRWGCGGEASQRDGSGQRRGRSWNSFRQHQLRRG